MTQAQTGESELHPSTLVEVQDCYRRILEAGGFGSIRIRIDAAGSNKERQIVSIETERKTFPNDDPAQVPISKD